MTSSTPRKNDAPSNTAVAGRSSDIFGSGEMADLTRAFPWGESPVGPIDQWPDALLITVNTILTSKHPMFLWWGDELIQFYNDAYRPSIREDKHPSALGQPGKECWQEIWHIIGPQIDAVMTRGEATWHENQLVPDLPQWPASKTSTGPTATAPFATHGGQFAATLVVCTETTESVLAKQQLERETQRLAELFQQAPAFFAALGGPEHRFELVNRAVPRTDWSTRRDRQNRPRGRAGSSGARLCGTA